MTTTQEILVVYLSITLAVFLTMGIVVLAYVIKIFTQLKRIADKVENAVDNAGEALERFRRTTLLASAGNTVAGLFKDFFKKAKQQADKKGNK